MQIIWSVQSDRMLFLSPCRWDTGHLSLTKRVEGRNFLLLERGYFVKILLRIKQSQKRLNAKQNTVIFVRRDTYKFPSFNISQRNNIMVDSKDR